MKLFYYEHCPFCIRVLMLIHFKNLSVEKIVLLNDDEETPIAMIGKKMLPVLQKDNGDYLPESLDILQYLDHLDESILPAHNEPEVIVKWLNEAKPYLNQLTRPRMIHYPFKEFATPSARHYFELKKSEQIGSFSKLITQTEEILRKFQPILNKINDQARDMTNKDLTWEDIYLFPYLLSLTLVQELQWPHIIKEYLDSKCDLFRIPLYTL
jgi:glutaredoxin 2